MSDSLNLMRVILNLNGIPREIVLDAVKKLFFLRTQNIHIEFEPFASLYDTLLNAVDRIHNNLSYGDEILENTKALLLLIRHLNWNRLSAKGPFAKCPPNVIIDNCPITTTHIKTELKTVFSPCVEVTENRED